MSAAAIAGIQRLKAKRDAMDQNTLNRYNAHKRDHPDMDEVHRSWAARKKGIQRPQPTGHNCHECIELVILRSLNHDNERALDRELCVKCTVTYDLAGLPTGADHLRYPIDDFTKPLPDGTPFTFKGLKSMIAAGQISVSPQGEYKLERDTI